MLRFVSHLRRSWKRPALIGSLSLGAVLAGGLAALMGTPAWYAPPAIASADRQKVRNNLIAAEQAFTENLRRRTEPFTYTIFQDDLNRWMSMRREIYPLIDELLPDQFADPFVLFDDGEITVAGRCGIGVADVVLSIVFVPTIEEEALVLRAGLVRCGSVRVPTGFGGIDLGQPVERRREETWPGSPRMWGDFLSGLHIETSAWWKNGGMDYRVLEVEVDFGELRLRIQPLGPHWARSDQD